MSFKETKKNNKPQINLEIDYKGMEADLSTLSGGELARVVLAFTLALNEMFNSPLLLLDECTASLDQDLTTTVFDAIRENFKSKTVIVEAHQVVDGVFDKIIKKCDNEKLIRTMVLDILEDLEDLYKLQWLNLGHCLQLCMPNLQQL